MVSDNAGSLYVADYVGLIEKWTPGVGVSVFATSAYSIGSSGIAFDSTGNLYVANYNNNVIEKFTPDGIGSVFATTGLHGPQFIAIQAPEPSPWVLLCFGLATLRSFRRASWDQRTKLSQ